MKNIVFFLMFYLLGLCTLNAHDVDYKNLMLKDWNVEGNNFKGYFLLNRNDTIFIEKSNKEVVSHPLSSFSKENKVYLEKRINEINVLNKQLSEKLVTVPKKQSSKSFQILIALFVLFITSVYIFLRIDKQKLKFVLPILFVGFGSFFYSFTDPNVIRSAFLPFAPNVNTFWDNNYFYVESKGIPTTHTMMVGISNHGWQQQVPIPQCYIGTNAWSIPLNPVMASSPVPVDQVHFTRGAIGIAVNGVPIFNPYTNTGVDAYLDGQLDNYGGHSGKGDDYHYHTAPLHLYNQTTTSLPIAYAFDGFPVYGNLEPDGTPMTALDANHGHYFNGEYHYHGTNTAPYMIAKFAGVVTEDATHQLIPQAQAHPVRTENWTPLNGALITSCLPNATNNGFNLSYTLNGVSGYATNYSWNGLTYTFDYVTPNGNSTINYNGFNQCNIPLSIMEVINADNLIIYPNPFYDKINLKTISKNENCTLYNPIGDVIYSGNNIEEQNFSQLSTGVYYLKVNNQKQFHKIIKQ